MHLLPSKISLLSVMGGPSLVTMLHVSEVLQSRFCARCFPVCERGSEGGIDKHTDRHTEANRQRFGKLLVHFLISVHLDLQKDKKNIKRLNLETRLYSIPFETLQQRHPLQSATSPPFQVRYARPKCIKSLCIAYIWFKSPGC